MSENNRDYTDVPKPQLSGEEIVQQKKTRILDTVAKIVTLLIAFLFWFYVFATNDATKVEEKKFELIPIEARGSDTIESRNLAIQNMSFFNIDVTLKGTRGALNGVKNDDIKAYINISDITEPGVYVRTLYYDIPTGLSDSPMGTREVEITVDTIIEKSFSLDYSKVLVENFILPASCEIDHEKIALNVASVTIEGPTLVLGRIKDIRVRSSESLSIVGSTTLTAVIEAIDASGEVVNVSSCKVLALTKSGIVRETVTVTVPIYQEKRVPVVIRDEDSLVSREISVSPAFVTVRGTPDEVNGMSALELGGFSVKALVGVNGKAEFKASLPPKYTNCTVTDDQGNTLHGNAFTVSVALSDEITVNLPASFFKTTGGTAEFVSQSVAVTVRATAGNEALLSKLALAIEEGKECLKLVVDLSGIVVAGERTVKASVLFSDEYESKLYEVLVGGKSYTVTVRPSLR